MNESVQQNMFEDLGENISLTKTSSGKIDVVKMNYIGAETVEWQELFDGFSSLKAITYSSGINFIAKLTDMFMDSEIIFGCEAVMSYSLQEIMAFQNQLIERIRNAPNKAKDKLLYMIDGGKVRLYVARAQLSHEKIYLLSSKDGRKRVVMGSANMSYNAFGGRQRENICYVAINRRRFIPTSCEWQTICL